MCPLKALLISAAAFFALVAAERPIVTGRTVLHGIFAKPAGEEVLDTPETSSGKTRTTQGPLRLLAETNRIPASLDVRFGFIYTITNLPIAKGEMKVLKVVKHPKMVKPDGKSATGFTFTETVQVEGGGTVAVTGYGFDHDYELVPGIWDFEIRFDGTTVCTQRFFVYKPVKQSLKAGN